MGFSNEFVEKVTSATNIVDLMSQYTQLKSSGRGYMGRCPFPDHPEKTPSFSVSEDKQVYHCFGCHKSGNVFTFMRDYHGMAFPDAVEFLANRARIPIERTDSYTQKDSAQAERKKQILKLNAEVAELFHQQLKSQSADHQVQKYLEKRKLNSDLVDAFRIGYAPNAWDFLVRWLQNRKVSMELAESARLIKKRDDGSGYYDVFRDRLMFTIRNQMGEVVGFGGRVMGEGEPKYLNSPESDVFLKSKILYGADTTSKHIRAEDFAIVVEGYMDLVTLWRFGFQNAVAPMGTALTLDQCRLIKKWTQNVLVLFDGDEAGLNAAERSLPLLLRAGLFPRALFLENDMDPDDFLNEFGSEKLREKIDQAEDLFKLLLAKWMKGFKGEPFQKVQLITKVRPILLEMSDEDLRKLYMEVLKERLGVSWVWLRDALYSKTKPSEGNFNSNFSAQQVNKQEDSSSANPISGSNAIKSTDTENLTQNTPQLILLKGASRAEILLMGLVLKHSRNLESVLSSQIEQELQSEGVKRVLQIATEVYRQVPEKFDSLASQLAHNVDRPQDLMPESLLGQQELDESSEATLLKDCILKIQGAALKVKMENLKNEIRQNPSPEKLMEIQKLNQQRLLISKNLNTEVVDREEGT